MLGLGLAQRRVFLATQAARAELRFSWSAVGEVDDPGLLRTPDRGRRADGFVVGVRCQHQQSRQSRRLTVAAAAGNQLFKLAVVVMHVSASTVVHGPAPGPAPRADNR